MVDMPNQYYIVAPGYLEPDATPEPLQFYYGNSRLVVFNLEIAPAWLFYAWICELARRAGISYLFLERLGQETYVDRWTAISILIQIAAMFPASPLITDEIYKNREEAMEKVEC